MRARRRPGTGRARPRRPPPASKPRPARSPRRRPRGVAAGDRGSSPGGPGCPAHAGAGAGFGSAGPRSSSTRAGRGFIPQNALKNAQLPNRQSTPKVRTNAALVWQLSRYFAFSEYLFGRHVLSLARDADGATWPPPSSTQLPLAGSSTAMQLGIAFAMPWPGIRRARCSAQSHPSFQTRKASPRR